MFILNTFSAVGSAVTNTAVNTVGWVMGYSSPIDKLAQEALACKEKEDSRSLDLHSLSSDSALVDRWRISETLNGNDDLEFVVRYVKSLIERTETEAAKSPEMREVLIRETRELVGCILYLADQETGLTSLASAWINPVDPIETKKNIAFEVKKNFEYIKAEIADEAFSHRLPVEIAKVLVTGEGIFNAGMVDVIKRELLSSQQPTTSETYLSRVLDKMACGIFNKKAPLALQNVIVDVMKAPKEENDRSAPMIESALQTDPSILLTDAHAARLVIAFMLGTYRIKAANGYFVEKIINRAMKNQTTIALDDLKTLIQDGVIYRSIGDRRIALPFILQKDAELAEGMIPLSKIANESLVFYALASALAIVSETENQALMNKICRTVKNVLSPYKIKIENPKNLDGTKRKTLADVQEMILDRFRRSLQIFYETGDKFGHYTLYHLSPDQPASNSSLGQRVHGSDDYRDLTLAAIEEAHEAFDSRENNEEIKKYACAVFDKMTAFTKTPQYIEKSIAGFDPSNRGFKWSASNQTIPRLTPWRIASENRVNDSIEAYFDKDGIKFHALEIKEETNLHQEVDDLMRSAVIL